MKTAIDCAPALGGVSKLGSFAIGFKPRIFSRRIIAVAVLTFILGLNCFLSSAAGRFSCKECLMDSKSTNVIWGKIGVIGCVDVLPRKVYLHQTIDYSNTWVNSGYVARELTHEVYDAGNPLAAVPASGSGTGPCTIWTPLTSWSTQSVSRVGTNGCTAHQDPVSTAWDNTNCVDAFNSFTGGGAFHPGTWDLNTNSSDCQIASIITDSFVAMLDSSNNVVTSVDNYGKTEWSGEYTDPTLRGVIVSQITSYPTNWEGGSASARFTFCDGYHVVATGEQAKYRFKIHDSKTNETYRIKWKEVTRYIDGGKADISELKEEIRGTGDPTNYAYSEKEHELFMPIREGITTVEDVRVIVLPYPAPPAGSQDDENSSWTGGLSGGISGGILGSCGSCQSSGGNGNGSKDEDVASFSVFMGGTADGGSAGSLYFSHRLPSTAMYSPAALQFSGNTTVSEVIPSPEGWINQVYSPQALAVVISNTPISYQIAFFHLSDVGSKVGSLYATSGVPYVVWNFTNSSPSTTNQLQINETREGDVVNQWNYTAASTNGDWKVSPLGGQIITSTSSTNWVDGSSVHFREVLTTRSNVLGVATSRERTTYRQFDWGEAVVTNAVGSDADPETTVYEYYSSADYVGGTVEPLKSVVHPNGSWEYYGTLDSEGKRREVYSSFADVPLGSYSSGRKTESLFYGDVSLSGSTDDGTVEPRTPRCVIERIGVNEVSRRYTVCQSVGERLEVQCTVPGDGWNASGNLTTTNRYYTNGPNLYRLKGSYRPDGTATLYDRVLNSGGTLVTNSVTTGALNSSGVVTNGSRTISIEDAYGNLITQTTYNIATGSSADGMTINAETYGNYDGFGRPQSVAHLDGTTEWAIYSPCCGIVSSSTNRDGVPTTNIYDMAKRSLGYGKNGVIYTNILDASGRVLQAIRVGTNGSSIVMTKSGFDLAGRLVAQTNALGGPTSIVETHDGTTGGLIRTTTNPDTGTRVEAYYLDGSLKSLTGTAVHGVGYGFATEDLGGVYYSVSMQTNLNTDGTPSGEWTKTYTDAAGRNIRTVYSGVTGTDEFFYNSKGQLERQVNADTNTTWFGYDANGEREKIIVDANGGGVQQIGVNEPDRMTHTISDYTNVSAFGWSSVDVRRSRTWQLNEAASEVLASESWTSVDGLRSASISFGRTNQSFTVYLGSGQRCQTNTAPDGTTRISVYQNGLLQSVTQMDTGGGQLGATTNVYDSHLRVQQKVDARNGATILTYNNADLTTSSTAQGLSTSTEYDTSLRGWRVTQPDGGQVTSEFYLTGELKKMTGVRTYPVEYTYDYAGRMQTMKTWTNYSGASGAAVTTWSYDGNRGWLAAKFYPNATTGAAQTNSGVTYTYTDAGRLHSRTWTRGTSTVYGYNGAGELTSVDYSDSTPDVTYTFDRRGRQTGVTQSGSSAFSRAFNDASLMIGELYTAGPLSGIRVTNQYDALQRRTNLAVLSGSTQLTTNTYSYNATSGRLETVGDGGGDTATYTYVANSTLVSDIAFKQSGTNRMTTSKTYDLLNRVTAVQNSGAGFQPVSFFYQNNNASQRTRNTLADSSYWVYQYDRLGQVTNGVRYWSDNTPVAGQQFNYSFDDIGNRKQTKAGGDATGSNLRLGSYSANLLNQYTSRTVPGTNDVIGVGMLTNAVTVNSQTPYRRGEYYRSEVGTNNSSAPAWLGITVSSGGSNIAGNVLVPKSTESFTYDLDGNLTSDSLWTNVWNGENHRTSTESGVTVPTLGKAREVWIYLPDGRWIERIISTNSGSSFAAISTNRFVWDGNILVAVLNSGNGLNQAFMRGLDLSGTTHGAGGVGGLLAVRDQSTLNNQSSTHFAAGGANGDVALLVNAIDGTESAHYEYGPFGEEIRITGPMGEASSIRFCTQYRDNLTDNVKYLYRDYATGAGRWSGREPLGEAGASRLYNTGFMDVFGEASRLNPYCIVGNDPVHHYDILGLTSVPISLAEAIASGNVAQVEAILAGLEEGDAGYVLAREFLKKVAECLAAHASYDVLKCKGCSTCTTKEEALKNSACLTAEVAGRALYLKLKCDYCLADSIAAGSAKQEKGHQIQLAQKSAALANCAAAIIKLSLPPRPAK